MLLSALLGGVNSVWADYEAAGAFKYLNTFDDATEQSKTTIKGSGSFIDEGGNFGYVFQNEGGALRTNYLIINQDFGTSNTLFTHASISQQLTICFWVNKKNATGTYSEATPLFTVYSSESSTSWPMFACRLGGTLQVNCAGWSNLSGDQNDSGSNNTSITWIDDNKWHFYAVTIATNPMNVNVQWVKVYIDGELKNSWTLDSTVDGQNIKGFLNLTSSSPDKLAYACLGGNQTWDWNQAADQDPAFAFDDFMVTNKALSADEINEIIEEKNGDKEYVVNGIEGPYTQKEEIGQSDKSGSFFYNPGNSFIIKKGQTYKLTFKNQGTNTQAWFNWVVKFHYGNYDFFVRADNFAFRGGDNPLVQMFDFTTTPPNWDEFKSNMVEADVDLNLQYTSSGQFVVSGMMKTKSGTDYPISGTFKTTGLTGDLTVTLGHELAYLTDVTVSAVANTGANGITTFSSSYHLDLAKIKGATAYYVSEASASSATLTEATGTVAAGEGLFLKGEPNTEVTIPLAASGTAISGNMLKGSPVASTIDNRIINYDNIYVLGATDGQLHNVATYVGTNTLAIPAGKAFLRYSGSASRQLALDFGDEPTGISAMTKNVEVKDNAYFDLQGRRVAQPRKGLYIVNGKKVVIK